MLKDLKQSTRQRFVSIEFNYPSTEKEARIVSREGNTDINTAERLVLLAGKIRNIREHGLTEGAAGTRLLIYAAQLISSGIPENKACITAISQPLTDDKTVAETLNELIEDIFG